MVRADAIGMGADTGHELNALCAYEQTAWAEGIALLSKQCIPTKKPQLLCRSRGWAIANINCGLINGWPLPPQTCPRH